MISFVSLYCCYDLSVLSRTDDRSNNMTTQIDGCNSLLCVVCLGVSVSVCAKPFYLDLKSNVRKCDV